MKNVYTILSVIFFALIIFGCESDSDSKIGEVIFWFDHETSIALQTEGAEALTFYLDGKMVGSTPTSVYATGQPECGQQGFITVAMNLGGSSSKSFSFHVLDQTEFEYWSGTIQLKDNTCIAFELEW